MLEKITIEVTLETHEDAGWAEREAVHLVKELIKNSSAYQSIEAFYDEYKVSFKKGHDND